MKVLWITSSDTFYYSDGTSKNNSYNGVGWVASQQLHMMRNGACELAIMFLTSDKSAKNKEIEGVKYYPIIHSPGRLKKLWGYYHPESMDVYVSSSLQVAEAIVDFCPDLIHVFGLECPLSDIITDTKVPCIVHLQGILSACMTSFFPPAIGISETKKYGSLIRERILRNGFVHAYNMMKKGAIRERRLFLKYSNFLGRTDWDHAITKMYSRADSNYYHVDEILRPEFYNAECTAPRDNIDCINIVSTISPTLYKGLDQILRTAEELSYHGIRFQWTVIGVEENSEYCRLICKVLGMHPDNRVKLIGCKSASEIVSIFQDTDIYFHPSYIDNSPNSICEAQMLGIPVIATNVGGVSSIVDNGKSGFLVPANEPHIAASHLIELSRNFYLRQSLSRSGRDCAVRRNNPQKIINEILNIYNRLIGNAQRQDNSCSFYGIQS